MPKVKDEYLQKKRNDILNAAIKVMRQKPLYELTMTDVIKEAGLSKGGIYRYYKNIDELLIAVLNKIAEGITSKVNLEEGNLKDKTVAEQIFYIFEKLAEYITTRGPEYGKANYELQILATKDAGQVARILPQLTMKQEGTVYMKLLQSVLVKALDGKEDAVINTASLLRHISASIDGITTSFIMFSCYSFDSFEIDVQSQLNVLAYSIVKTLER